MKGIFRFIGVAVFLFVFEFQTKAHPHLFIDADIQVELDSIGINRIQVSFAFDKMYSRDLISRFDTDQNGTISNEESNNMQENAFSNLINYNYFIHVIYHKNEIKFTSVYDFKARIKDDDIVVYSFALKPNIIIGSTTAIIKIAPYDHTYYIDVSLNKESVSIDNSYGYYYDYNIIEDKQLAYYYDQIFPDCIVLKLINYN